MTKKKGETKDAMFRKFTRAFIDEDLITEVRKRQYYKKPSLKRKDDEKERLKHRSRLKKQLSYRNRRRIGSRI